MAYSNKSLIMTFFFFYGIMSPPQFYKIVLMLRVGIQFQFLSTNLVTFLDNIWKNMLVYIFYDILIYSKSLLEHVECHGHA